jgi:hypothetical protein
MNEIDPRLINQAHLLGQRRTPTRAEQKEMERANIMLAHLQVTGTALSSLLEGGADYTNPEVVKFAQSVTEEVLKRSESTKDDFDGNVALRKVRNQLAAQLIYSDLRGGYGALNQEAAAKLVNSLFDTATEVAKDAEEFAEKEVNGERSTDSPAESSS